MRRSMLHGMSVPIGHITVTDGAIVTVSGTVTLNGTITISGSAIITGGGILRANTVSDYRIDSCYGWKHADNFRCNNLCK